LWLGSEPGKMEQAREIVKGSVSWTRASDSLKEWIEESNPLADQANMYVDLLSFALGKIEYGRIVDHIAEEIEKVF
jgi:hypothetical protein